MRRLSRRWLVEPTVHEVLVDHPHRAVFRTTDPAGRPVFVKVEVGQVRARREVVAIGIASRAGIPVPELRHVELGDLSVFVVVSVHGRPLGTADAPPVWAVAARHLADLHAIEVDGDLELQRFDHREADWVAFMRWWAAHEAASVVARGMLDRSLASALLRRTDQVLEQMAVPRRSLLHGDCQPDHVYVDRLGRVAAFIDWGDAATGDPLWDIAVLTAHHAHRWTPSASRAASSRPPTLSCGRTGSSGTWALPPGWPTTPSTPPRI